MNGTVRFGVSMDVLLMENFDRLIELKGYPNRSEAIRELIRASLEQTVAENDEADVIATVTLLYDHHANDFFERLAEQQDAAHNHIISSMNIHLDTLNSLEVLAVRGRAGEVKQIANKMLGIKSVKHGQLVIARSGEE